MINRDLTVEMFVEGDARYDYLHSYKMMSKDALLASVRIPGGVEVFLLRLFGEPHLGILGGGDQVVPIPHTVYDDFDAVMVELMEMIPAGKDRDSHTMKEAVKLLAAVSRLMF
jgi:hypothetical protein